MPEVYDHGCFSEDKNSKDILSQSFVISGPFLHRMSFRGYTVFMDRTDVLALFVKATELGSLSGAARSLGLSLPSVSRHMTALEERLGTRLLIRTTRKLALTDAGRVYYARAKQILTDLDEVEASLLADAAIPTGKLNVCGPTLFGRAFMLPLLARFLVDYPSISLEVKLLDRRVNIVEEGIDLAIGIGALQDSNLIVRKLGSLLWVVTAAPAYLDRRGEPKTLEDLSKHDCLVYSQRSVGSDWRLQKGGKPMDVRVPVRMRANTLEAVVAAALEGNGLVYAPAWQVFDHIAAGRLKVVLREHELPPIPINAIVSHTKLLSAKVRLLLDFFVKELARNDLLRRPSLILRSVSSRKPMPNEA
jgi:DNA-binding transcriptional LysR family regulator